MWFGLLLFFLTNREKKSFFFIHIFLVIFFIAPLLISLVNIVLIRVFSVDIVTGFSSVACTVVGYGLVTKIPAGVDGGIFHRVLNLSYGHHEFYSGSAADIAWSGRGSCRNADKNGYPCPSYRFFNWIVISRYI
jgi:hypothetical protein